MKEDLMTDLIVLESHLDSMLNRARQNSLTLKQFQAFEMGLLKLNSLAEMIEHIINDAKVFFDLDVVTFCLIDEKGAISQYLEEDGYDYRKKHDFFLLEEKPAIKKTMRLATRPFLGRYNADCALFFPQQQKPSSVAVIPLTRRGLYLGSLNLGSYQENRFIFNMATDFVEHMISVVSICLENNLNFETMRRTSLIDTLTGINNRLFLEQRIGEELDHSFRKDQPLTCLFLDIDFFKRINDEYGHQAGDQVLSTVADSIKNQLRSNDVLARYGGEEFIVLLIDISEKMAFEIADRIRNSIKNLSIKYNEQIISVTISIGASTYKTSHQGQYSAAEMAELLIHTADSALYRAKNNGRDRVEMAGEVNEISHQPDSKTA